MCGFQVPTQLKNIFPAARLGRQQAACPTCGAAEEGRAGVLPCYQHLLEIPEQIHSSPWQEKHHQGSGELPVHTAQCLRHQGTQPHWLRTGWAPWWVPGGRRELLPHFTAPVTEALKGDRFWPDPWKARDERGLSPALAQLLCYQTVGDEGQCMDGCGGMWQSQAIPCWGNGWRGMQQGHSWVIFDLPVPRPSHPRGRASLEMLWGTPGDR